MEVAMAEAEQGRVASSIAKTCAELRRFEKWRESGPGMRGSPRRLPRRSLVGLIITVTKLISPQSDL